MSINGNINQKANLIWSIADVLTGTYKPHEYGEVILPMMVIKRFDCILEDNLTEIQSCYEIVIRKDFKRINSSGLVNIMNEITEYGMMIRIV